MVYVLVLLLKINYEQSKTPLQTLFLHLLRTRSSNRREEFRINILHRDKSVCYIRCIFGTYDL